ncbi:MAG TPA: response regulator [Pyrinomonadaceae bacterium]|jgi:response regulator RpfG family c-di-GMP phosphodiesterase
MNEKVLVIDDEQDSVDTICDYLILEGISCRGEVNPEKAIESFTANPTDVVIVDYLLTDIYGITGLEVISQLKKIKPFTRFILISGYIPNEKGSDEEISERLTKKLNVDRYISKPIDIEDLTALIRELLNNMDTTSNDWLEISKKYVSEEAVSSEEVRKLNEEFKQSIIEVFNKQNEE